MKVRKLDLLLLLQSIAIGMVYGIPRELEYPLSLRLPDWLLAKFTCQRICHHLFRRAIQSDTRSPRNRVILGWPRGSGVRAIMAVQCLNADLKPPGPSFHGLNCPNGSIHFDCGDTRKREDFDPLPRSMPRQVRIRGKFDGCCSELHTPYLYRRMNQEALESWQTGLQTRHRARIMRAMCRPIFKELHAMVRAFIPTECIDLPAESSSSSQAGSEISTDLDSEVEGRISSGDDRNRAGRGHQRTVQWQIKIMRRYTGMIIDQFTTTKDGQFSKKFERDHSYRLCVIPMSPYGESVDNLELKVTYTNGRV